MRQRTFHLMALTCVLGLVALFGVAPYALGSPVSQQDATDQQATIIALVEQRFTQTAQASGPALTATAEAALTATADALATQSAAIALTVDAAFYQALTATAQGPAEQLPAASLTPLPALGYRVLLTPVTDADRATLEATAIVIEQRLQALGLAASVAVVDGLTIQVDLIAPENLEDTLISIREAGLLEFVDFTGLRDRVAELDDEVIVTSFAPERDGVLNPQTNAPFQTVLSGADIASATVVEVQSGYGVQFVFTQTGGERMVEFTRAHVGEPLAIVIDGEILSTPIIQSEFGAEGGLLQGNFSEEDANRLALQLNLGALPVGLDIMATEPLTALPETVALAATSTPTPTATPDLRPTATTGSIRVAEEVFEGGRMFYIQPLDQIWVMVTTGEGEGSWSIYPDTFEEGEAEVDPSLVPPEGRYQPARGFGKLWRENPEVREALGWGLTPEFGYDSQYRYQPGGQVLDGVYTPAPGYHVLFSLDGEAFRFNEVDNTWSFYNAND